MSEYHWISQALLFSHKHYHEWNSIKISIRSANQSLSVMSIFTMFHQLREYNNLKLLHHEFLLHRAVFLFCSCCELNMKIAVEEQLFTHERTISILVLIPHLVRTSIFLHDLFNINSISTAIICSLLEIFYSLKTKTEDNLKNRRAQ